jgi:hypothetical protein
MSDVAQSLEFATRALEKEMGQFTQSLFFFSDGAQRVLVDGLFDIIEPKSWTVENASKVGWDGAEAVLHLLRFVTPGEAKPAWRELANKLEVFALVSELPVILGVNPTEWIELTDLVTRAYSLSPFAALWAVEGVGHYYADMYWERNGPPKGLLESEAIPERSLLMLHAGIGLSFANRLMIRITRRSSTSEIRRVIEQFLELCHDNSRTGYLGPAIESLGLVTREFYPNMVGVIDEQLFAVAPDLIGYFWHGVGRALYFSREYFVPIVRTAWASIDREAPSRFSRGNAMSGLAWAATLVNMRQPVIMEMILRSSVSSSPLGDAFANGVSSSILMREDTTPGEEFVMNFYQYTPPGGDPELSMEWKTKVTEPTESALRIRYPQLKRDHELGEIFSFCPTQNEEATLCNCVSEE